MPAPAQISEAVRNRFRRGPIESVEDMAEFVQTRAAFVAQTSLFGYLKERMGRMYSKYFEDKVYVESIRIAQMKIYYACAADLAIFATAYAARDGALDHAEASALARHCFRYAMENSGRDDQNADASGLTAEFSERADSTLWPQAAIGENAFTESPQRLIDAAPVIDEFKKSDSEIVMNSIRFRWRDVREQFRKRADGVAICSDFRQKNS